MNCPNCHHAYDDQQLTCAACGQVNARSTLENLQNLEFLTTWLDEHQDELAAPGYRRLRQSAELQLAALRGGPAPRAPAVVAAAPVVTAVTAPAEPARTADQVAHDLALVSQTLNLLNTWEGVNVLDRASATGLRRLLTSQGQDLRAELAGRAAPDQPPDEPDVIRYAVNSMASGQWSAAIQPADRVRLTSFLQNRRQVLTARHLTAPVAQPVPTVQPTASPVVAALPLPVANSPTPDPQQPPAPPPVFAAPLRVAAPLPAAHPPTPAPQRPPAPPQPVAPPRPPIDWGKVWERSWQLVVSGALLRGLLYLGALMIVASAVVLVVRFWTSFPAWLQIGFVAAVPLTFYAGGFVLRRLKIPVAGSVFTGIGALLVAVDLAAVYQLGGLSRVIELPVYWLGASLVCAALYLFTLYRARGEFFGYLTLIGAGNVGVALAVALRLTPEWWLAAGAAVGAGTVAVAGALKDRGGRWPELGRPARYSSQLALPVSVFLALALAAFARSPSAWGLAATLALVAAGYAGLAWRFNYELAEFAAVGSSLLAGGATLNALAVPTAWLAGAGAGLAAGYSAMGRWRARAALKRAVRLAWYGAAGLLALAALAFGLVTLFTDLWAAVIGLALLAGVLAGWARLFQRGRFTFAAAALFVVPFTAAVARLLTDAALAPAIGPVVGWVAVSWTALALGYMALAAGLRQAERHARWLCLCAHGLTFLAGVPVAGVFVLFALGTTTAAAGSLVLLAAGAGALAVYVVSAGLHASGRHPGLSRWLAGLAPSGEGVFLWPIGALLPAELAIAWWRWAPPLPESWAWLGVALAGLSLVYVLAGQWLARRRAAYRLPWHTLAYALAAAGSLLAWVVGTQLPLPSALVLDVASLAALAACHRRPLETFLAAALFVAPVQLTLRLTALPGPAYALAYALLAALVYYPLGLRLRRAGSAFAWPVLGVGYAVAAGALGLALLGRAGLLGADLAWAGAAAPLVALALLWASSYHLRDVAGHVAFAWAGAAVLCLAYWQTLGWLAAPTAYTAAAWVGLAFAGLLAGRALALLMRADHWLHAHAGPLQIMSAAVCVLGLGLTVTTTQRVLISLGGRQAAVVSPGDLLAAILAQGLAVVLASLAARLYHNSWPLWIAPALSVFPVTLFFVAYSSALFGQPLTIPQFGLVWLGLGLAQLLAAALLDRAPARYAHGMYATGYALIAFAAQWTAFDRPAQLIALGAGVLVALASQALAHAGRHRSFDDLLRWLFPAAAGASSAERRGAGSVFLFAAAYAFPVWLALLLAQFGQTLAGQGLGLAALAVVYIGLGRLARRLRPEYAWPLYTAGYALSVLGPAVTWGNERLMIAALALTAALYAASAFIFEQPVWLLLANGLAALIAVLVLDLNGRANAQWLGPVFMALAIFDVALAQFFRRGRATPAGQRVANFEITCLAPGYVLSALALAAAASLVLINFPPDGWTLPALRWVAIGVFSAAVALYTFSAWRYRATVFVYLAAWLAAVPYALLLGQLPIRADWLGLAWLPLIVGYILGARRAFHHEPLPMDFLRHWAMPFYLLAYALTVAMISQSQSSALTSALAFGAAALVYGGTALLFRKSVWLFPSLLALHLGVLAAFGLAPSTQPAYFVSEPMLALTWMMAAAGYLLERRAGLQIQRAGARNQRTQLAAPWALPFLAFAALDVLVWQGVAAASPGTGQFVALGNALLLGLLAMLWLEPPLAYGALALLTLAAVYGLALAGLPFTSAGGLAALAGLGFGFYLAARLAGLAARRLGTRRGGLWEQPLAHAAIALAILPALGLFAAQPLNGAATAAVLGLAGAQAIGEAYRLRRLRLGYGGVALLLAAWSVLLLANDVAQPQWYALPAGLYLLGVGYLERRVGRKPLAVIIEALGLAVLLVTTFSQSLDGGAAGLPYFILLIVEAMGAMTWGALRRLKSPFFIGLAANAINVLAQLALLFAGPSTLIRWLIIGGTGLFIVAAAVFVERQRDQLVTRALAWREALAAWD